MTSKLKIGIIGGTGKAGKYLVNKLLSQGFEIKMLVRNPEKVNIPKESAEIIVGDIQNYEKVKSLITNCNAVLSTLGQDFGKKLIFLNGTQNIINAMNELQIKRYIMLAGIALNTPNDKKNFKIKLTSKIMKLLFSGTINDKQKAYNLLSNIDIDWTVVRVPMIKMTDSSDEIKIDLADCPGTKINSTDLADFMIKQISDETFIQKAPFIAN
ncbi:MAG: NAD(P)H-binding protein [Bacteroidales bacterium]|nr:NAD(P)H-binding protein [Bacteroidales bacterium]